MKQIEFLVERYKFTEEFTVSCLYGPDYEFYCHILEDKDRNLDQLDPLDEILAKKVKHQTAIPTGRYEVKFTHSRKYNKIMPELLKVPGFHGIRIHSGNFVDHTSGCLLPGMYKGFNFVDQSKKCTQVIEKAFRDHFDRGDQIFISIRRKTHEWLDYLRNNEPKEMELLFG